MDAVRNELNCKRCQKAVLTQEEKELLDGLYCLACRKKFGYYADSTFDDNSRVLKKLVMDALPTLVDIPVSGGIKLFFLRVRSSILGSLGSLRRKFRKFYKFKNAVLEDLE